jgi:hypothetical protein
MQIVGLICSRKGQVKEINVDVNKVVIKSGTIAIMVIGGLDGGVAHAGTVTQSLQPLVDILKDLAEPVSYGFMVKGFMKIMAGEEHEGMKTIKGAIGGFIGIQWIPYIFKIIKGITF